MKNIRLVKYQTLSFSDKLSSDRIDRAQDTFGEIATRRFLCFSLYLLGLNRQDIGKSIDLPAETVKSIIKSLMLDGISALEDRRRRPFAPIPQVSPELPSITIKQEGQLIVVDLGVQDRQIKLNQHDQLQMRTILLTMLNSGLLTNKQVHDRHTLCEVFRSHVESHPSDAAIHYIMDNLTTHYHDDFCQTVAELSGINYSPLATGHERRQWLQSEDKRIVVHFIPFHASWLNMVEIWFGILKRKCLKYDHFTSVKQLRIDITGFINTWNEFFAHPFKWSYIGKDLYAKAVRRFSRLLSIQTDQMDSKFLTSQLLLMSNIADNYIKSIPVADWFQLLDLAAQSDKYISKIIEMETGPIRHKKAHLAYTRFLEAVIDNDSRIARAT